MNAVKAAGDYELDVLGIPFGGPNDKDADGEYFTSATLLHLEQFPTPPVVYHHGYGDDRRPERQPQYIGRVTGHEVKADGVWFRVVLDKAHVLAQRVWEAAKRGVARASSGSVLHLVRYGRDGQILEWPVAELSIFEIDTGKAPANKRAVALPVMKAVYEAAGMSLPLDIEPVPEGKATGEDAADAQPEQSAEPVKADVSDSSGDTQESARMDVKIKAAVSEPVKADVSDSSGDVEESARMDVKIKAAVSEAVAAALAAERETQAKAQEEATKRAKETEAAIAAAKVEWDKEAAKDRRLPGGGGGSPMVSEFGNLGKYDNYETEDLAFLVGVLGEAKDAAKSRFGPSQNLIKALAVRYAESDDGKHRSIKSAMKMAGLPLKANELNQSTLSNYGDEWVALGYSNSMWARVTEKSDVVSRIPTIEVPPGVESITIPIESTPPTFYKVAQASAQDSNTLGKVTYTHTSSKMGTGQRVLSVGKLGARTIFSGELEEDSLLPWAQIVRQALETRFAEIVEALVINGDTETGATTNINEIGGTPASTDWYLVLDGFRKLALVTNTANSRSAGTFDETDFLETLKLMGIGGKNAINKQAVSFILDVHTHWKALEIAALKTRDVFSQPTIENGRLMNIYGVDVIASPQMHEANQDATYGLKANSVGKTDLTTAANNTYGAILAVRWDQWRMGWARRIRFELDRVPQADATEIVCNARLGLNYRDTEASAISYGVILS